MLTGKFEGVNGGVYRVRRHFRACSADVLMWPVSCSVRKTVMSELCIPAGSLCDDTGVLGGAGTGVLVVNGELLRDFGLLDGGGSSQREGEEGVHC